MLPPIKHGMKYLFLFILLPHLILAQFQDSMKLEPILISGERNNGAAHLSIIQNEIDKLKYLDNNLGQVLMNNQGLYIKSYGPSHSSTPSIRGASGNQTMVLWHGLPISSPTLGLQDLSLIPFNFFTASSLSKSTVSEDGAEAIGGTLDLQSENNSRQAEFSIGEYGTLSGGAQFHWKKKDFQSNTKIQLNQAENDFIFEPKGIRRPQTNAAVKQVQFLQAFDVKISDKLNLGAEYWHLNAQREIPPTLTQTSSQAIQDDWSHRMVLNPVYSGKRFIINTRIAYFLDEQLFQDGSLVSNIKSGNAYFQTGYEQVINKNLKIKLLTRAQNIQIFPINEALAEYSEWRNMNSVQIIIQKNKTKARIGLTKEFIPNQKIPLAPSFMLRRQFGSLSVKYLHAFNYRIPSINDRFWKPGGNTELEVENGWSQELDLRWSSKNFELSFIGFNRKIDQWILWTPSDEYAWWVANNISKVWSRGLESSVKFSKEYEKFSIESMAAYQHIRSTSEFDLAVPKISKGDQLIYTPEHQIQGSLQLKTKNQSFKYSHVYFGKSTGINEEIESYHTAQLFVNHRFRFKQVINIFLNINNIWNHQYVIIERRPMPGRIIKLGFQVNFN